MNGLVRECDPETSHEAAESLDVAPLLGRLFDFMGTVKDTTAEQASDALHVDKQSITPRFVQLEELGMIERTGEKRANRSGRNAQVWRKVA